MPANEPQDPVQSARPWLVSACLLGQPCRYDGASRPHPALLRHGRDRPLIGVCPEELGALGTPRPAAELRGGDGAAVLRGRARVVRTADGVDVTEAFVRGARRAAAARADAELAILKARSPSCGTGATHIDGEVRPGDGVFAALLRSLGLAVQSDEDLPP